MIKVFISLLLLLATALELRAEGLPGHPPSTDSIPAQNIYVRTDQDYYVAGEQIWMKIWIYAPLVGAPYSSSVYVELSDRQGRTVSAGQFAVFDNAASATLRLQPGLAEDMYVLRAYTAWSLHCGQVFTQPLYIYNPSTGIKRTGRPADAYDCSFYPESGRLIENCSNRVAFRLKGYPLPFQRGFADIVDADGKIFGRISAYKDDLGLFQVTPRHGLRLFLRVKLNDSVQHRYPLPPSYKTGLVMRIEQNGADKRFVITRNQQDTTLYGPLLLTGYLHHRVVLRTPLSMEGGNDIAGIIQTSSLPEGILNLVLTDSANTIIARRTLYMRRADETTAVIKGLRDELQGTSGHQLTLSLSDSVCGVFSILVRKTADSSAIRGNNNLEQGLLADPYLSEIPAAGKRPAFAGEEGDMAVLTTGWKYDTLSCRVEEADTSWIRIKGRINYPADKIKTMPDAVTWIVETKDSSRTAMSGPVSAAGEFGLDGLYFEDTAVFYYQFNAKKPVQKNLPVAVEAMKKPALAPVSPDEYATLYEAALPAGRYPGLDSSLVSAVHAFFDISQEKGILLEEVKVKAIKLTPEQEVNKRYTSGIFSSMSMARTIDLENNPDPSGAMNVFEYLKGKMPGLRIGKDSSGKYYIESPRSFSTLDVLQGGNGLVDGLIYVNEIETGSEVAAGYPMSQIALIKFYPPGALMALPGVGISCVLSIYTRNASGKNDPDTRNFMGSFKVRGYDAPGTFTRKQAIEGPRTRDLSRTLYWDPNQEFTGQKEVTVQFANSDFPGYTELILEGVTCNGKIIHYRKILGGK